MCLHEISRLLSMLYGARDGLGCRQPYTLLSHCLSVCLSACLYVCLCVSISVYMPVCVSLSLPPPLLPPPPSLCLPPPPPLSLSLSFVSGCRQQQTQCVDSGRSWQQWRHCAAVDTLNMDGSIFGVAMIVNERHVQQLTYCALGTACKRRQSM